MTSTNCGVVTSYPFWSCSTSTLASISVNSSQIQQPPPQWVTDISNQINSINALGWSPDGWFGLVLISKFISVPGYFAIKGVRKMPRFQNARWMSHTVMGGLLIVAGLIGFFGLPSLVFFSVCLGGLWLCSYPYLGRFQKNMSE